MNKVYFKIKEQFLYLDYMLEIYDSIPLFYVCKDDNKERYLVLCKDFDNEAYLITKITLQDLSDMLSGKRDIRASFLRSPVFWTIRCLGKNYNEDSVIEKNITDFPLEFLPKSGEYYELYDDEHKDYAKRIDSELKENIKTIQYTSYDGDMFTEEVDSNEILAEYINTCCEIKIDSTTTFYEAYINNFSNNYENRLDAA